MGLGDWLKRLFGGGPQLRDEILQTTHQQGESWISMKSRKRFHRAAAS